MEMKTGITPTRNVINGVNAPLLENALDQKRKQQQSKHSLIWGTVNVAILSIILYDLAYTCPLYKSYLQYIEYVGAIVLVLNILYHFGRFLKLNLRHKQVPCTPAITTCLKPATPMTPNNKTHSPPDLTLTPNISLSNTPMNTSALSWMSNSSPNESINYPVKSESWLYSKGSPNGTNISPTKINREDTSGIDFIADANSLQTYLKDFEANEKKSIAKNGSETTGSPLSSFWSHPLTKSSKDISAFLKRCQYQLSSPSATTPIVYYQPAPCPIQCIPNYYYGFPPFVSNIEKVVSLVHSVTNTLALLPATSSGSPKTEERGSPTQGSPTQGLEAWRGLNVDIVTLTQWNSNLRTWISQTILQRLVNEITHIDEALQKHGLNDIQIGKVGLYRLRKTAQTAPVIQFIPSLPTIIPFLELTPNQEYLVKRIKELGKAGCMSEFKWNGGSSFNGKDWDNSLPTDGAIIMHLFASYMDTQLLPLPNQPDVKSFTGYHYLKLNCPLPTLTDETLLIQECSLYPPHYRVIVGTEIYELVKGYNNLFHSILLFLYFVNKKQHGMVGRVNLGRSGVNMLWIIQSGPNTTII